MSIILFISFIAAVILVGLLLLKRERRKLQAERELKLKIAEGTVMAPLPALKKRKKRKRRSSKAVNELEQDSIDTYLANVPGFLNRLLAAFHHQMEAKARRDDAYAEHSKSSSADGGATSALSHPQRIRSFKGWLSSGVSLIESTLKAQRQLKLCDLELDRSVRYVRDLREKLLPWISYVEEFANKDDFPPEFKRLMTIAKGAERECVALIQDNSVHSTSVYYEREGSDPEVEHFVDEIVEAMSSGVDCMARLSTPKADVTKAHTECKNADKAPEFNEPARPNDAEVQSYIAAVIDWQKDRQTAADCWRQALPALFDAVQVCKTAYDELQNRITTLENAQRERMTRQYGELPKRHTATFEGEEMPFKAGSISSLRHWWEAVSEPSPVVLNQEGLCCVLSDNHIATLQLAKRFFDCLGNAFRDGELASITRTGEIMPARLGAVTSADLSVIKEVRTAMRSLGFAVAQRNVVKAKLEFARQAPEPAVGSSLPSMEETNVDSFIRAHRRYGEDCQRIEQAATERKARLNNLQLQFDERHAQVGDSAAMLSRLLEAAKAQNLTRESLPADLSIVLESAAYLVKVNPPRVQPEIEAASNRFSGSVEVV